MKFAETIYRLLLKAYPARFADEYGADMHQLFRDQLRAARSQNSYLHFWIWTAKDYLPSLLAEHFAEFRRNRQMRPSGRSGTALVPVGTVVKRATMLAPSFYLWVLFMAGFFGYRGVRWLLSQHRGGENGG